MGLAIHPHLTTGLGVGLMPQPQLTTGLGVVLERLMRREGMGEPSSDESCNPMSSIACDNRDGGGVDAVSLPSESEWRSESEPLFCMTGPTESLPERCARASVDDERRPPLRAS
mmetsp:Transcript_39197/g.108039  ORF Transcript_39197/g.108039 Transcript_39197/m.108039 type:complete len:114 (-) Transcript_39197:260-601(-)